MLFLVNSLHMVSCILIDYLLHPRACKDPAAKEVLQGQLQELQAEGARMKSGPSKAEAPHHVT